MPGLAGSIAAQRSTECACDLGGTVRAASAEATLAKARPVLRRIGITRVANVTGLDHVGVPTWIAVRPLARSLTVSQGKGLTDALAQASAVMESIEVHHAEHFTPRGHRRSLRDAAGADRYVNPLLLPVRPHARIVAGAAVEWIEGEDLTSGRSRWLPRDCVNLDFTTPRRDPWLFLGSSNGLASGNTRAEAVLHGVCEAIERDQTSYWYVRKQFDAGAQCGRLDLDSVTDEHCRWLLGRCRDAGLQVAAWCLTQDLAVPSFMCTVYDSHSQTFYPQRASGFGCHPYRHIALSRAITEALQSRLTCIAGGRDDVFWSQYRDALRVDNAPGRAWIQDLDDEAGTTRFADIAQAPACATIGELIDWVATRLAEEGFGEIVVVDLKQKEIGIPVVHVTVPGLEGFICKSGYTPGPRMQALLKDRWPS